ncbi:hypothetical protein MAR_007285, partial [Mya arenaria]
VVRRDMVQALRKKRPGMEEDIENVLLHQDNGPVHRAWYTELELDVLGIGRSLVDLMCPIADEAVTQTWIAHDLMVYNNA